MIIVHSPFFTPNSIFFVGSANQTKLLLPHLYVPDVTVHDVTIPDELTHHSICP